MINLSIFRQLEAIKRVGTLCNIFNRNEIVVCLAGNPVSSNYHYSYPRPAGARKPTIIHIAVIDGFSIIASDIESVNQFLKDKFPDHKIIVAIAVDNKFSFKSKSSEEIRKSLISQIQKDLEPEDKVSTLVINTHSNTFATKEFGFVTALGHVGSVNSSGVDDQFKELFAGVKGQMAEDATIVFDACSTMCGPENLAAERAGIILDFFGIKNGSVYGATMQDRFVPGTFNSNLRIDEWLWSAHLVKILVPLVFLSRGLHDLIYPDLSAHPLWSFLEHGTLQSAGVFLASSLMYRFGVIVANRAGFINRGKIFISKNGKISKIISVKKYEDKLLVYGVNNLNKCEEAVETLAQ